jgi:threonine aldolase
MRFLAAGWVGMLENGAWLKHAQHANRCAALLAKRMAAEANLQPAHPVEANAIFVPLPQILAKGLRDRGWEFYDFIGGASRFMCSWNTSQADIDALMTDLLEVQTIECATAL